MSWWSNKFKRKDKSKGKTSVAEHVQAKNQVVNEYTQALRRLETKLTPEERYLDLVKTYRKGRDLMVVPEAWRDNPLVTTCDSVKIFVNTPVPSIVRTR